MTGSFNMLGMTEWVDDKLCWTFNWACPEPPAFFDSTFGQVYFWMLLCANIFVILLLVSVVGGFLSRFLDPMPRTLRERRAELSQIGVTVLLPCYLPNEHEIMWSTIAHIIERIEYDFPFTVICCYNTPQPMIVEDTLSKVDGTVYPNGRRLRILKVEGSSSKAENLNAALRIVDTPNVVIYDADHHPDPESLLVATAAMEAHGVSCVQGSTHLRTRPNLLAAYINAEFFVTHFVFFPAMQFITRMGVFGGSNALWRTDALRAYQFRDDVQTEDIDLSTRALLGGRVTIRFEPRCRSGELPPATFRALYRQRLRWALGWDQVTLQHCSTIWVARPSRVASKSAACSTSCRSDGGAAFRHAQRHADAHHRGVVLPDDGRFARPSDRIVHPSLHVSLRRVLRRGRPQRGHVRAGAPLARSVPLPDVRPPLHWLADVAGRCLALQDLHGRRRRLDRHETAECEPERT